MISYVLCSPALASASVLSPCHHLLTPQLLTCRSGISFTLAPRPDPTLLRPSEFNSPATVEIAVDVPDYTTGLRQRSVILPSRTGERNIPYMLVCKSVTFIFMDALCGLDSASVVNVTVVRAYALACAPDTTLPAHWSTMTRTYYEPPSPQHINRPNLRVALWKVQMQSDTVFVGALTQQPIAILQNRSHQSIHFISTSVHITIQLYGQSLLDYHPDVTTVQLINYWAIRGNEFEYDNY